MHLGVAPSQASQIEVADRGVAQALHIARLLGQQIAADRQAFLIGFQRRIGIARLQDAPDISEAYAHIAQAFHIARLLGQ